jgi:hypothetical protein
VGESPAPFDPGVVLGPPSAETDARVAMVVTPFEGLERDEAAALQASLVAAFRKRDVAASAVNPAPGSQLVRGGVLPGPGGTRIIDAELVSPGGIVTSDVRVAEARLDDSEARAGIATRLAAGLLDGPAAAAVAPAADPAPKPAEAPARWRVRVANVKGAPGDGEASLTQAVRRSLQLAGYDIVDGQAPGVLSVEGSVSVSAPRGPAQNVAITWRVLGPDGAEKGRIDQANDVPTGSLDTSWGPIASAAGSAAAGGLADLIDRLPPP